MVEIALLKYTPFVSHLNNPNLGKKKIKSNQTKCFLLTNGFPFYFKVVFFIYNIVFTWSNIIYTKLTSGTV